MDRRSLLMGMGAGLTLGLAPAQSAAQAAGDGIDEDQDIDEDQNYFQAKKSFFDQASRDLDSSGIVMAMEVSRREDTLLLPFKDFDYYCLSGPPIVWRPNEEGPLKPVAVPAGFVTDLTSIPAFVWATGLRPEGRYALAAVVHDYLYWEQDRTREEADRIFQIGMEDMGVEMSTRTFIYHAVHLFGGRAWRRNARIKASGERRLLKRRPFRNEGYTTTWEKWKKKKDVFMTDDEIKAVKERMAQIEASCSQDGCQSSF